MPIKSKAKTELSKIREYYDYNLLAVVIILICFGLVMLYSASSYEAAEKTGNDMYYLIRQGAFSLLSIGLAIFISRIISFELILKCSFITYVMTFLLMEMV